MTFLSEKNMPHDASRSLSSHEKLRFTLQKATFCTVKRYEKALQLITTQVPKVTNCSAFWLTITYKKSQQTD